MTQAPLITPDWTLAELKREHPGVELILFAHFGVGSRERAGFGAEERLEDLLRRHLIFDADRACRKLSDLAAEDARHSVLASELARLNSDGEVAVIDARSAEEFERCRMIGARLLSADSVSELKRAPRPIVTVCRDGSQAPSASRVLRAQGLQARHLVGGLEEWSRQVEPELPILYPLNEAGGHWYLLADEKTLRFRRSEPLADRTFRTVQRGEMESVARLAPLLQEFCSLEMIISTPHTFAVRGLPRDLREVVSAFGASLRDDAVWEELGQAGCEESERTALARVLSEEAGAILGNHKGTVEIKSYHHRVLQLELGGGCAGCASAEITTQRELAASLYRAVPLLDAITSS